VTTHQLPAKARRLEPRFADVLHMQDIAPGALAGRRIIVVTAHVPRGAVFRLSAGRIHIREDPDLLVVYHDEDAVLGELRGFQSLVVARDLLLVLQEWLQVSSSVAGPVWAARRSLWRYQIADI
jgi:hypothetical protein